MWYNPRISVYLARVEGTDWNCKREQVAVAGREPSASKSLLFCHDPLHVFHSAPRPRQLLILSANFPVPAEKSVGAAVNGTYKRPLILGGGQPQADTGKLEALSARDVNWRDALRDNASDHNRRRTPLHSRQAPYQLAW